MRAFYRWLFIFVAKAKTRDRMTPIFSYAFVCELSNVAGKRPNYNASLRIKRIDHSVIKT